MTVIEADAQNIVPVVADSVPIYAGTLSDIAVYFVPMTIVCTGQRYSLVVTADQAVDNYCV